MKSKIKKIPVEIKYIFFLFVITRVVLTIVGVYSRKVLFSKAQHVLTHSKYIWLDIWGAWDSGWYLNVARKWYKILVGTEGVGGNYGFFPLYPLLMRIVEFFVKDYYIAGLLISNFFLIIACIFIYKLVKLDSDKEIAKRSIKYLFLFPTAFILSGVFSESLFLALIIISFYYSKKQKWHLAGMSGYFAALTRPVGVFIFLPLLYEYCKVKEFKIRNIKKDILYLLLVPIGTMTFAVYTYFLTGDLLAYVHVKQVGGHHKLTNPFSVLYMAISSQNYFNSLNALFAILVIAILVIGYRKIGFSYFLLGILFLFVPLSSGFVVVDSLMRFSLVIFPLFIIAAKYTSNRKIDIALTILLGILQGILMILWVQKLHLVV